MAKEYFKSVAVTSLTINKNVQMNACELPCGSVLKVQPADSEYKKNGLADLQCYGPGQSSNPNKVIEPASIPIVDTMIVAEDTSEDLDDFFASLA